MPSGPAARYLKAGSSPKDEGEGLAEVHLKVTGMTCGSCVANIEKSLARLTGTCPCSTT